MLFCLIENGEITDGPRELPRAWRHVSGLDLLAAEDLAELGWLPAEVTRTEIDELTHHLAGPSVTIEAGGVQITYTAAALDPADARANLKAYAARKRFEVETGGLTINGVQVATDRESQSLINGAYALIQREPERLIKWKALSGFVELDAAAITALAAAVATHVQAAFSAEAEVVAAIDAGLIVTREGIDAAGWPA